MIELMRELCILAVFCSLALSLCPEGGGRRILQILSSAALLAVILNGLGQLDYSDYALGLARYREKERSLTENGNEFRDALNRLVIEQEYAAYIEDKARALGIETEEIRIGVRWSMEGVWVPETSYIRMKPSEHRGQLSAILFSDFGIPAQRQEWDVDE